MRSTLDPEQLRRRKRLLLIYAVIAILGLIGSFIARHTIFGAGHRWEIEVAVAAPLSGPDAPIGEAIRRGAELYAQQFNQGSGNNGRKIRIAMLDETRGEAPSAEAVAVVGHWREAALAKAIPGYATAGLPLIGVAPAGVEQAEAHPGVYGIGYSSRHSARFLANYVHNVLGQKLVTIVHDGAPEHLRMADDFEEIFQRFGTRIANRHNLADAGGPQAIGELVRQIEERRDPGTLFLALDPAEAAQFVRELRDRKLRNGVVGTDLLGANAFSDLFPAAGKERYLNDLLFSSPLLFDTANEAAQRFQTLYWDAYKSGPDWLAAHTYEGLNLVIAAMVGEQMQRGATVADLRRSIGEYLAGSRNLKGGGIPGITGTLAFNDKRGTEPAVQVGQFDGADRVSALTQLQPLRQTNVASYIEEVKEGRMLYVNDRFMYKTNVVYTGVIPHRITKIDPVAGEAEVDFSIWFRYRGDKFDPAQVEFLNAQGEVKLGAPVEESQNRDMHFKLFRSSGKFRLNTQGSDRPYGSEVAGIAFRHRDLNRNNLLFVVDVLGLGLQGGASLLQQLREERVVADGWLLDRAWIAQDLFRATRLGKPEYVGYGSVDPEYSRIDQGLMLRPAQFSVREFVPGEYMFYLAITVIIGSLFALGIDIGSKHPFWRVASFFMRLLFWPLMVLSVGNAALDLAIAAKLPDHYIRLLETLYQIWWWLVPPHLAVLALERFLWKPLEERTQRIVPNVIRGTGVVIFYAFAILGILAFVFDQTLTSLLASSGLLAMIIGLAIKANIDNVFSGIVINVERPFRIGDWIAVGTRKPAEVIDITWRTLRLKNNAGEIISIPNARVSAEVVVNHSVNHDVRCEINIFAPLNTPPKEVISRVNKFLAERDTIPRNIKEPKIVFAGAVNNNGYWSGRYRLFYFLDDYQKRAKIENAAWKELWDYLHKDGVLLICGTRPLETEPMPQPAGERA